MKTKLTSQHCQQISQKKSSYCGNKLSIRLVRSFFFFFADFQLQMFLNFIFNHLHSTWVRNYFSLVTKHLFFYSNYPMRLSSFLSTAVYQTIILIAQFFLPSYPLRQEVFLLTIFLLFFYFSNKIRRFFASIKALLFFSFFHQVRKFFI